MEIHRFEKIWLAAALLLIVGFIATVTYGAVGMGVKMVDDSGGTVDPDSLADHPKFSDPGVERVSDDEVAVYVIARQFFYQPGTSTPIEIPADTEVTFYVTSSDVIHGFEVAGTNLNTMVIPGQISQVTVVFDEPGEYGILCHEYCGAGHHAMEGKLIVVPESEFEISAEQ